MSEGLIDEALRGFVERGCATIVGTVSPDGMPHAQRAYGISVVGPTTIRAALDADDAVLRSHLEDRGAIALTASDVRDLTSRQLKGRVIGVEEPTDADLERCRQHNDELFRDIEETDFYPRMLTERLVPLRYVIAVVAVEDVFDQTPGPAAGARVGER